MTVFKRTRKDRGRTIESRKYYGWLKPADGPRRLTPLFSDKDASQRELVRLQDRQDRIKRGTHDPFEEPQRQPLTIHLEAFVEHVAAANGGSNTDQHVKATASKVRRLVKDCRWETVGDIRASDLERVLKGYMVAGMAPSTRNAYLKAVKGFAGWLVNDRRTNDDRLAHVQRANEQLDKRHPRRAIGHAEFLHLLDVTRREPTRFGLDGECRAFCYATAAATGFRGRELDSLTWGSFSFGTEPAVTVKAAYSKRRRLDVQPLPEDLAADLEAWRARLGADADDKPFPLPPCGPNTAGFRTADMLKPDLEAAGIAYLDENGDFLDFHALRVSFCTWVVQETDASVKDIERLVRHGDIRLTLKRYAKPSITSERSALRQLPSVTVRQSAPTRRKHG